MEVISVLSGKGGVGKTTIASNLGISLANLDKKVLLIDADIHGANLMQHLGLNAQITLNDVLNGNAFISQAYYRIHNLGVVPSQFMDFSGRIDNLKNLLFTFNGEKDFVIIDGPPGAGKTAGEVIKASDSVIIITEPERTSITNAYGILELCKKHEKNIKGIIVNRSKNEKIELKKHHIEEFLENPILGVIPEQKLIRQSLFFQTPIVLRRPNNIVSRRIKNVASKLANLSEENRKGLFNLFKKL